MLVRAYYKEYAHHKKRKCNGQYNAEAYPKGMVYSIIVHKDKRAEAQSDKDKDNSTKIFPFPRDDQDTG